MNQRVNFLQNVFAGVHNDAGFINQQIHVFTAFTAEF